MASEAQRQISIVPANVALPDRAAKLGETVKTMAIQPIQIESPSTRNFTGLSYFAQTL
jgi:hypothetical protein